MAFGAVIGIVGCGIPPLMPTLILSVLSLLKDGFLAAGTLRPPLPEGALPGLPAAVEFACEGYPPFAVFPELLILIIMLLLIVVFPYFPPG